MEDSRVSGEEHLQNPRRNGSGTVSRIRLENFMCHSSLQIELGECVNFITGQNGSGKSAILTALCVAFGSRARGTQRATTLKDFIKTGCSYALVVVEMKNQGDDAFKSEIYGDVIIIERRITESSSTTIDVENPCVIMSQDKSREFLHSGNDKDKFKFFFKATLLQQVSELLQSIRGQLDAANAIVDELESSIRPIVKELNDLQVKIKNMEHVEEISQQVQQLKKKLAWAWVYDVDKKIQEHAVRLEKLKERIPTCQAKIDHQMVKVNELKDCLHDKKIQIASMMEKTSEVRRMKDELQHDLSLATRERLELEEEYNRRSNLVQKLVHRVRSLDQQVHDIREQHVRNTQADNWEIEERIKKLQEEFDAANLNFQRLKEEEHILSEKLSMTLNVIKEICLEIDENESKYRDISSHIRDLQRHRSNKVTAFGGERVINLLRVIERHHRRFIRPPIGPIGAHVTLVNDDMWALAIEHAIGRWLNAFIVTDHKDSLLLRGCAKEANYGNLQIIIYDFTRPKLNIPNHMLPHTNHPNALSLLRVDNPTVMNVLVDMGSAERQVLARDYEIGKSIAFDQRISNLKEVYTIEGYRMFSRGSVETVLPPNKRIRTGRLCSSIDDQINCLEKDASKAQEFVQQSKGRKRNVDESHRELQENLRSIKKQRMDAERNVMSKQLKLRDAKNSYAAEASFDPEPKVDELCQEILKVQEEMQEKNVSLEKLQLRIKEAEVKANKVKLSFENICESANGDIDAFEEAERELMLIEDHLRSAETEKAHYEGIMDKKVLPDIRVAEKAYEDLQLDRQESYKKASIICPEDEIKALGGCAESTPEQLSAQLTRLRQRLEHERQRYEESIDDLREMYERKERKIKRKQETYKAFREKLSACQKALDLRWSKFQRNATLLKRQLTWQFNGHLRKKGISGQIKVNYEDKTLSVEVKMPQDASNDTVRDTRGLSGGERSFSTLCFALALHEMTEAPFRAMDEFDVFMDAVSRKISLDTLVDFAVAQGSQWIFITPHDISMVKPGERIKKQQMAAPRA
ncbi:structural maintenance of chromosomes protein 6B-like protein isoform X1 [Cinnamomum micranthum f. kanehirae]|uniref:Structural maintenance of chromosomes protein 6B-like protein isoform X1 n=1 Tax=Cinnamomum micranthum f. kanehirae TaxID=337451 RepID=A0A443P7I5_9MAGN|nr:structural maintenance of chromosomes protein 6B-like protein isoform X1 [Cinnamomum micranthum f. kanehirae]